MNNGFEFRLDTSKGRLYAYVESQTPENAINSIEFLFFIIAYFSDLRLIQTKLLKRCPSETSITLLEGGQLLGGKAFWYAVGRGVEYEFKLTEASLE